jgi:hypothetical protein
LSFPKGISINDGKVSENTHVQYATVIDAIRLIKRARDLAVIWPKLISKAHLESYRFTQMTTLC